MKVLVRSIHYAFILFLFVIGCELGDNRAILNKAEPEDVANADFFPLDVGNAWYYEYCGQTDTLGVPPSFVPGKYVFSRIDRMESENQFHFDTALVFQKDIIWYKRIFGRIENRVFQKDGTRIFEIVNGQPLLLYDFSRTVEDAPVVIQVNDSISYTISLLSDTTTVVTPAGVFESCRVFAFDLIDFSRLDFLAPDVGLVGTKSRPAHTAIPTFFYYCLTSATVGGESLP